MKEPTLQAYTPQLPPLPFFHFLSVFLYRLNYSLLHLVSYFTKVSRKFVILVRAFEIY